VLAPADCHIGDPASEVALSHAILRRVAAGELAPQLRIFRPARAVQFGPSERRAAGFAAACRTASHRGYRPVVRLVGGRAAAHHEDAIIFERFAIIERREGLADRYATFALRIAEALRSLGADVGIGPVEGEYCPGQYSLNSRGELKVVGTAQRVVGGASLISALVIVDRAEELRELLAGIYRHLQLSWHPATAGCLRDHYPDLSVEGVATALRAAYPQEPLWAPDRVTLELSDELVSQHRVAAGPSSL
jgi:octanoyl-[GcvH]:protein N-octanoyltransferase